MLVADNFRLLRHAASQNNNDIDELIISIFDIVEGEYPGFTEAFREAAPELGSQFISDGITLGPPDDTPTPNPHPEIVAADNEQPQPEADEQTAPEPEAEIAPDATPEPEPEPELKPKPVKKVPTEKQKQALEKAREIRRAAKLEPNKNKESVEPIVFV
jgi:outer membrane biosynthesis protein TonB